MTALRSDLDSAVDAGKCLTELFPGRDSSTDAGQVDFSEFLRQLDNWLGLDASFLFIEKPLQPERLLVRGSTVPRITGFHRDEIARPSGAFIACNAKADAEWIQLRRARFQGNDFWETIWRTMTLGPYAGPWSVWIEPLAEQGLPSGYLLLISYGEKRCWQSDQLKCFRLIVSQLRLCIGLSESIVVQKKGVNDFLRRMTNAGQDTQLHNIFSPLQALEIHADLAKRAMKRNDIAQVRTELELMRLSAWKASDFARSVLNLTRIGIGTNAAVIPSEESTNIYDALNAIDRKLESLVRASKKELVIRFEPEGENSSKSAMISNGAFEEIISNLIHNAQKYAFAGTKIKINTRIADGWRIVDVVSCGIVIREQDFDRVFELGFRTPEAARMEYSAVGFGLYRARELAAKSGGRLYVNGSVLDFEVDANPPAQTGISREVYRTTFRLILKVKP